MISTELSAFAYSKETIHQQLEKIFADSIFAVSDILKRFLLFIVEESLEGRSNRIKEYTIGVNVLNKPSSFNPRQDAIVRIHAGRLRRALSQYYKSAGSADSLYISIPKGSYLPVFSENNPAAIEENDIHSTEELIVNNPSITRSGQFIITGEMQHTEDRIRINVQMINTETHEEVWNQVVEYKLGNSNVFDIQEDITKKLVAAVGDYCQFIKQQAVPSSRMAVA